jgi:hypothetical protein
VIIQQARAGDADGLAQNAFRIHVYAAVLRPEPD